MKHRLAVFVLLLAMLGVASEKENSSVSNGRNWVLEVVLPTQSLVDGMEHPFAYIGYGYCGYQKCFLWGWFDPEESGPNQGALFGLDPNSGETFTALRQSDGYLATGTAPGSSRHVSPNGNGLVSLQLPGFRWMVTRPDGSDEELVHLNQETEFGKIDHITNAAFLPDESVLILANVVDSPVFDDQVILRWRDGELSKVWGHNHSGRTYISAILDAPSDPSNLLVGLTDLDPFGALFYQATRLARLNTKSGELEVLSDKQFVLDGKTYQPFHKGFRTMITNDGSRVVMRAATFDNGGHVKNNLLRFDDSGQISILVDSSRPEMAGSPIWDSSPMYMGPDCEVVFNTTETMADDGLEPTNLRNAWYVPCTGGTPELIAGANDHIKRPNDPIPNGTDYTHFIIWGILDDGSVVMTAWANGGGDIVVARRLNPHINQVMPETVLQGGQAMLYGRNLCLEGYQTKVEVGKQKVSSSCGDNRDEVMIVIPSFFTGLVSMHATLTSPDGKILESNEVLVNVVKPAKPIRSPRSRSGRVRATINQSP